MKNWMRFLRFMDEHWFEVFAIIAVTWFLCWFAVYNTRIIVGCDDGIVVRGMFSFQCIPVARD